jgi:thioredoxin-like negative regulator of GroEL
VNPYARLQPGGGVSFSQGLSLIGGAEFDAKVKRGQGPIIVEFMSFGCPHCRAMQPVLSQVAAKLAGTVTVYQVSVDAEPALANAHGITGVPTFIAYQGGKIIGRGHAPPQAAAVEAALKQPFGL